MKIGDREEKSNGVNKTNELLLFIPTTEINPNHPLSNQKKKKINRTKKNAMRTISPRICIKNRKNKNCTPDLTLKCYVPFLISCSCLRDINSSLEDFVGHFCSAMIRAYCELEDWYGPSLPGTVGITFSGLVDLQVLLRGHAVIVTSPAVFGSHISRVKRKSIFQLAVYDRGSRAIPRYPITELRRKSLAITFCHALFTTVHLHLWSHNRAPAF